MPDSSTPEQRDVLEQRIDALEQRHRPDSARRLSLLLGIALVAFCGLIGWQVHLVVEMNAARNEARIEHLFWMICQDTLTPEKRADTFLQLVSAGNAEWRSAQLTDLGLSGANLSGALLPDATLDSGDFTEAILIEADLTRASLQLADLTRADLQGAILDSGTLLRARLDEANFRSANLTGASLEQVTGDRTVFVLTDLADSNLLLANLSNADLTGANLAGADLKAATLRGAKLALTDFSGANLEDVDLTNSNWWRSRGLTTEQLTEYLVRFAPDEDAEESRRNDFQLWMKSAESVKP